LQSGIWAIAGYLPDLRPVPACLSPAHPALSGMGKKRWFMFIRVVAALALCGLASCGKDDQTSANSGAPRNAGGNPGGNAELENAAINGDLEKLKAMLKADPGLKAHRGGGGGTLLHMAADGGQKGVAEFLLAGGADVNARNNGGGMPLHRAAAAGSKEVVELLIAKGAEVNARNRSGETPLHRAVAAGHDEVAEFLRQHGGTE
jgi:ankyrin repeat protein